MKYLSALLLNIIFNTLPGQWHAKESSEKTNKKNEQMTSQRVIHFKNSSKINKSVNSHGVCFSLCSNAFSISLTVIHPKILNKDDVALFFLEKGRQVENIASPIPEKC